MKKLLTLALISTALFMQTFSAHAATTANTAIVLKPNKSDFLTEILNIALEETTNINDRNEITSVLDGDKTTSYIDSNGNTTTTIEFGTEEMLLEGGDVVPSNSIESLLKKASKTSFFTIATTDLADLGYFGSDFMLQNFLLDISESNNRFTIDNYSKLSNTANINYNDLTFKPEIYKQVATKNLLFYTEFKDLITRLKEFDADEFDGNPGMTKLLDGNTAFFITATNEEGTLPKFTLATDIESSTTLKTAIQEIVDTYSSDVDYFEYDSNSFYFAQNVDNMIIVVHGQIIDDYFVISSDLDVQEDFGSDSSTLSSYFSDTASTLNIFYADPGKLSRLKRLVPRNQEAQDAIDIASSIKKISGYSKAINAREQETSISFTFNWRSVLGKIQEQIIESITPGNISTPISSGTSEVYELETTGFYDVSPSDWYYGDVTSLHNAGIVSSSSYYRPGDQITRAEFIAMIMREMGMENTQPENTGQLFTDVPTNTWYAKYIANAYELGIVNGDSNGRTFRPNAPINRAEAVKILDGVLSQYPSSEEILPLPFVDVEISDWYYLSLQKCHSLNLVNGTTAITFEPSRNLNRAEAAALINRLSQF